jgi:NADPH:quinone reductase
MARVNAIRIRRHGGAEVMVYEEVPIAQPGPGQVLVRHTAVGVNFIDAYHRSGAYALPSLPHGIGLEAAGVVEGIGENVTEIKLGERVGYAAGPPGAYATSRVVDASTLVRLPRDISDEVAAAVLLKGMTAEYLIRRTYRVQAGDTVLFHAAAGGVGTLATQWLAHLGVTVIGTVSSEAKADVARANGVAHAIVYTKDDFARRVHEITRGEGVHVVYDSVGRSTFHESLECLRPRGMLVAFGYSSGKPDPVDMARLAGKSLFLSRPMLTSYIASRHELLASASAVFDVIASGAVKVEIRHRFPLEDAVDAHRALEDRKTTGPVLMIPAHASL